MIAAICRPITFAAAAAWLCSAAFAAERVAPELPTPWQVDKHHFGAKKANEAFSGFACGTSGMCVLAVDEGRQGAFMRIKGDRLVYVGEPFDFSGVEKELDAEAAAVDGGYFYVAGSHAAKRETCCDNSDSRRVLPADGRRERPSRNNGATASAYGTRCAACLNLRPMPFPATAAATGLRAVTASTSRAWRRRTGGSISPCARRMWKETRYVVGVDARALFEGGELRPSLAKIPLGANKGFRDLIIADGEALALVGPSDGLSSADYSIVALRGLTAGAAVQPGKLATLDLQTAPLGKKGALIKPEAIALLELNPSRYRLLVLSDGGKDGAPLVFDIPRTP